MSTFNKTFFLLLTCLIIFSKTLASNYQFQTLTSDFKDITHYENQVIVYGNDNLIKYSTDFGETWENKYLENVEEINFIKLNKDNIDYIVNDSLYLYSNNINSKPQIQKMLRNKRFYSYSSNNEYIVFAYDSVIDVYSKNDFSVKTISLISKSSPLLFVNGKSLFTTNYSEKLKEYNLETASFVKEYADSCINCRDIVNIKLVNNKYIINRQSKAHGNFSYYFSIDISTKEQIEIGTFLRGYAFDVKPKILGPELQIVADSIRYHKYIQSSGQSEIDELFFGTYQIYNNEVKKVADNNSNYFNDVITSSAKLSNGNVIVAGKKNAIFLSKDNGLIWETKMAICYEGVAALEKSKDKIYLHNTPSGIISESLDSGINWKTQKRYLEDFKAATISSLIDEKGYINYLYIDSVFKKSTGIPYEFSFMKNNIDIDNYRNLTSNNISVSTDQFNVYSLNSKFQLSDNPLILFFDKSNNLIKKIKLDSMIVLKMDVTDTNNLKLLIGERKQITLDTANGYMTLYGNSKTKLIETKDGGKNWTMLDIWDSTLQRTLCNIKSMDGNADLIVAYNLKWLNSSNADFNKNIFLLKIQNNMISVIYSDVIRLGQLRNLYFIDKLQNNYILGYERYFLKVDENFKVLDSIPLRNAQSFIQSVNLGNKLLLLSNSRGKLSYFQESPTNSIETEFDNIEPNTDLTHSTHIELYDILGRSIATFPSYEKLKAEIENYPAPHLIKWRDGNGIFHFEKMK